MMDRVPLNDFRGRKTLLIGLARSHVALARYLSHQGAQVQIMDQKQREQLTAEIASIEDLNVDLRLGGHRDEDLANVDVIFVTPGAPRDLPILERARERGIAISSEIELLFARSRAPIVGITGSAGKTTTTTLVGEILRAEGRSIFIGGNIGVPLIERVDDVPPESWIVLELSSYQLESLQQSAHIGAVLNVTPNHLDRHVTFERYRESKFNLVRHQTPNDWVILGADDSVASGLGPRCRGAIRWFSGRGEVSEGAFRRGTELIVRDNNVEESFARTTEIGLPGDHNVLNVLAAAAITRLVGASPAAIRSVATSFQGVEHRLEFVRELAGIRYYNDSIATAPERTLAALRSFNGPLVLIAGGRSKHLPMEEMARAVVAKVHGLVLIGEMAAEIEQAVRDCPGGMGVDVERAATLDHAVRVAHRLARTGDAVLLSPSGTSFDQFRDFEDRGRQFKAKVWALEEHA